MNSDISNISSVSFSSFAQGKSQEIKKDRIALRQEQEQAKVEKQPQKEDDKSVSDKKVISFEDAKNLAKEGNKILENVQRNLEFKVDDATQQVVMTIVDKESGDVIRQLPSEEALELAKRMLDADGSPGGIVEDSA